MQPERLVGVERGTCCLRVLRHELEIGERRDRRDGEGHEERRPRGAADLAGDLTGQGVDACAEDVPDDEEQEQLGPHHPFQLG